MIIKIAGNTVDYQLGSIDIDDAIGERSTASFNIIDKTGALSYSKGQQVQIYEGNVLNLVKPFTQWVLGSGAVVNSDYSLTASANLSYLLIPVTGNKTYTFSCLSGIFQIFFLDINGVQISGIYNPTSFTTPTNAQMIRLETTNTSNPLTNPQLEEGSIKNNFEPYFLNFSGIIDRPLSKYMSLASNAKLHSIQCVDNHYIADKRIIAKAYQNMLAGDIVKDIIANYLSSDGVTAGTIQDGPTVTEAVFNYIYCSRALERLSEIAGYEFNIDANKKLNFFHRATNYNNTVITETSDISNVQVEPVAEEYRNKQYIKAGMDTTDPQTQTFKGDGTAKTFTLGFPVAKVPTITVNGATQTVGINGLDSGKQWYWNKGDNVIVQDSAGTALTSAQTLSVTYQGLFNIVAISYDQTEISRMAALDGTTGIYEEVTDDPYITDRQTAFDDANAKLKRYAKVGRRITFDTKIKGLQAGQLIQVILPSYNINDYYLIESSKAVELGTIDGRLVYSLSVVDGSATGGWANFFKQLANKGEAFVLRENIQEDQILITLNTFSKTWASNDAGNIFADVYPSETLYPSNTLFPMFEPQNRVKYLTFYDASLNEIFRKPVTKQTLDSTGKILTSTTYIAPYEIVGTITNVGWVGGIDATTSAGSGYIVDRQIYNKTKTNLESIQIDKTDMKGW